MSKEFRGSDMVFYEVFGARLSIENQVYGSEVVTDSADSFPCGSRVYFVSPLWGVGQ